MSIFKMLKKINLSGFSMDELGTDHVYNHVSDGSTLYTDRFDMHFGRLTGLYTEYCRMSTKIYNVLIGMCYALMAECGFAIVFDFMRTPVVGYSCLVLLALIMVGMVCQYLVGENKSRINRKVIEYRYLGNIIDGARNHYMYEQALPARVSSGTPKAKKAVNHFPEELFNV